MVKFIEDATQFGEAMELSKTKLVVIDFTATWCPPCKMIAPVFEELATANPEAEFLKCDVDDASDVAQDCNISAMPTFQFYKNGAKVAELMGANVDKLKELISEHK